MKTAPHKLLSYEKLHWILVTTILTSCSNIPKQTIAYIEINSNVSATCKFTDAWGTRLIKAPGIVYADPKHGPAKLLCKSNGYQNFIATEIGNVKNKQPYPTMISVSMSPELPEINPGGNQSVKHVDNVTTTINQASEEISNSKESINIHILKMNPSHYTLSLFSMRSKKNAE